MRAIGQNIRYSGVNCALGPSKSIRYSGDFVIAGFVKAGFVSTYFTVILSGFQMLFVITGSSLQRGSLQRGPTAACVNIYHHTIENETSQETCKYAFTKIDKL